MFDRLTDRARKVMGLARQEAARLGHAYIGTEHILLGLVQEGTGVAASVLENLGVDPETIRHEVESLLTIGTATASTGQIPFTPRGKRVLDLFLDEATDHDHTYIGTEHILIGLFREDEGIAAQAFRKLKVDVDAVRHGVLQILSVAPRDHHSDDDLGSPEPVITREAWRACRRAYEMASERERRVGPLDLLFGLLDLRHPEIEALLAQWGIDLEGFRKNVADRLDGHRSAEAGEEEP